MNDFEKLIADEVAIIRIETRDAMPDWPWWFGFAFGPTIPPWDEEVNPA